MNDLLLYRLANVTATTMTNGVEYPNITGESDIVQRDAVDNHNNSSSSSHNSSRDSVIFNCVGGRPNTCTFFHTISHSSA